MATLVATDGIVGLNMFAIGVEHDAQQSATSSEYVWSTASGQIIHALSLADDITASATSPLGGTIHTLKVDDSYLVAGLNAKLLTLTAAPNQEKYWRAILAGDTTIYASNTAGFLGSGDFLTVASGENLTGGDDIFETTAPGQAFIGDARFVDEGAILKAGNDTIGVHHGTVMSGDTTDSSGRLVGGDDRVVVDAAKGAITVVGDSEACGLQARRAAPLLTGGNDTIIVLQAVSGGFIGDVIRSFAPLGTIVGGDDKIDASASAKAFEIVGDVFNLRAGTVKGGNDTLIASAFDSFGSRLVGDVSVLDGGTLLPGEDKLIGGSGGDTLYGDFLENNGATITITKQFTGNDSMYGGDNGDGLNGQVGNDTLDGGRGDDFLDGGSQSGGAGDVASFDRLNVAVSVDLVAGIALGQGSDSLSDIESVRGSNRGDALGGDAGANRLEGLNGDDSLFGRGGADTLIGGNGNDSIGGAGGNDTIAGGAGADTMNGGAGADVFDYDAITESGPGAAVRDLLLGFIRTGANRDILDFHTIDAKAAATGNQDFDFIDGASFSAAGQIRFFNTASQTIVEVNTSGTGGAEMSIAIDGVFTMTEADFVL